MKKSLVLMLAMGLVLVLGGVAMAADSNTVTVTANVVGTCKFNSAASTLAFGALDPSGTGDGTASTSVTFWCTKNSSYSVSDDNGKWESGTTHRMQNKDTPIDHLPYSFSYNPASGTGSGRTSPITLNISGTVAFNDYQNAAVGPYEDTVVISITP